MVQTDPSPRWMQNPPSGEDGAVIARLLRQESECPAPALEGRGWARLESRLRTRRRWGRWTLLGVGLPVLAAAAGVAHQQLREPVGPAPVAAGAQVLSEPRSAPVARPVAGAETRQESPAPAVTSIEVSRAPARPRAALPAATPAPAAAPEPTAAELDAIEASAAQARRSGDAQAAERGYLQLARSSGLRAENALYELGLVRLHLEKDTAGALAAWQEYRDRFPAGQLATEVDLSVLAALERAGRVAEAVREGESFLAARSQSERGGEVHALLGSLLQQRGDCARALPHLEAGAQALLSDARADELAYRRALCLRALGSKEVAASALREYLERFPAGRFRASVERALAE